MEGYHGKQFITRKELYHDGFSAYKLRKLVDGGNLLRVNRNYFENPDHISVGNEFNLVHLYTSKGVICLISAAIYHKLTTSRPFQIDVALPRRTRIPKTPDWPAFQFYLFSEERYQTGIETVQNEEDSFMIYDAEKSVCDVMFYRNKLGFEPAIEILKNYLRRNGRDINKLMRYAEKLRCGKLLREYLEVMV